MIIINKEAGMTMNTLIDKYKNICVSSDSKTVSESSRTSINANAFIEANPKDLTKRAPEHSETVIPFLNGGSHIYNKVCYSGRLDPMARGTVMLLVDDECKMMEMYNKKNKTYKFEIIFGLSTDTDDVMGLFKTNPISSSLCSVANTDDVMGLFKTNPISSLNINITTLVQSIKQYIDIHVGTDIMQDFHDFSSIKYKGKSLWYYALNKIPIDKPKHMVTLYNAHYNDIKKYNYNEWKDDICMKINNIDRKNNFRQDEIIKQYNEIDFGELYSFPITITVSSGFYVRQFVADIMKHINFPILTHDINRISID